MIRRIPASVFGVFALVSMAAGCSGDNNGSRVAASPPAGTIAADSSQAGSDASQWINGLRAGDVTALLESKGFDCSGPSSFNADGVEMQQWDCKKQGDGKSDSAYPSRTVSIVAKDPDHVRGIIGLFLDLPSSKDTSAPLDFFQTLAGVRYADGNAAAAQKWIESNSTNGGQTAFGSAKFLFAAPRELRILAVGLP